jgi:hypothetical protein
VFCHQVSRPAASYYPLILLVGDRRGCYRMVVWFTTTCAISAYHRSSNLARGGAYSIQHYVIKFSENFYIECTLGSCTWNISEKEPYGIIYGPAISCFYCFNGDIFIDMILGIRNTL